MKKIHCPSSRLVVFVACIVVALRHSEPKPEVKQEPPKPTVTNSLAAFTNFAATNQMSKLKTRFSEFSDAEKEEFRTNFFTRYKPALVKWCNAFSGRVPVSSDAVTPDNLAERIGSQYEVPGVCFCGQWHHAWHSGCQRNRAGGLSE